MEANGGGFWQMSNVLLDDWTLIDGSIGAFAHSDDCGGEQHFSSGRLMVSYPSTPRGMLVASSVGERGVFYWDATMAAPEEVFDGLPESATYEGRPSALAVNGVDDYQVDREVPYVLVGYRVITDPTIDPNALYLCPADFDPAVARGTCVPVVDPDAEIELVHDVRDIEVDPNAPGRFLVADGGASASGGVCGYGESTVWAVEAWVDASGQLNFDVFDTDPDTGTATDGPTWLGGNAYYTGANPALGVNCVGDTATMTSGDLMPPSTAEGSFEASLSTITVDPLGDWAFAFYPMTWAFRDADAAGIDVGWDTVGAVSEGDGSCTVGAQDLDCADWALAWAGDVSGEVPQNGAMYDVAVRPAATLDTMDVVIGGSSGDYRLPILYGGTPTSREPSDRACELTKIDGAPTRVAAWAPQDATNATAWATVAALHDRTDPGLDRGVFYSWEDPTMPPRALADEWCSRRLSGDDLEHRQMLDLDWGSGEGSAAPALRHLYLAGAGGGVWDGAISW